jgi:hypothetical protein
MLVALQIKGRRYIEHGTTTTVISGERSLRSSFTMGSRQEQTDDNKRRWRIAGVQGSPRGR